MVFGNIFKPENTNFKLQVQKFESKIKDNVLYVFFFPFIKDKLVILFKIHSFHFQETEMIANFPQASLANCLKKHRA
jgi:hypothetical protein